MHRHAVGGERGDMRVRDVLVVEGDGVTTGREGPQHVEIVVVADHHVGRDEGRPVAGRVGEDPQRLPEGDHGLVRHPRQLTRTDHADHRQPGPVVHEARAYWRRPAAGATVHPLPSGRRRACEFAAPIPIPRKQLRVKSGPP